MALADFVPVILFTVTSIILQRDLYNKMSKGAFALFAAGTIDIICAGSCKAIYKLFYATGICDMEPFNSLFFPVQSIGFLLAGLGIVAMLTHRQTETSLKSVAPAVVTGTSLFIVLMVAGVGMIYTGLSVIAVKLKKPALIAAFVISFFLLLSMGYLSSRDFTQAGINWAAQGMNVLAQGLLLYSVHVLHKAGMADLLLGR